MLPDDNKEDTKELGVGCNGNLRPCKPGQTNNPHGRPLGSRNRATIAKEWLEMLSDDGSGGELPNVDLVMRAAIKKAMAGDIAAFQVVMDSGYGKLTDKSQVEMQATVSRVERTIVDVKDGE